MNNLNNNFNNDIDLAKVREMYIKLVDYLKEIMFDKNILERPSYAEMSRKLGFTYNFIKDKINTLKRHIPQKKTFNDIYSRLSDKFKKELQEEWLLIEKRFIKLYNHSFPSNPKLNTITNNSEQSLKRRFFNDIKDILKNQFPNIRIFDADISRLLYSKARALKDIHLKKSRTNRKLTLSMLFSFIFSIRNLNTSEFTKKIRDIQSIDNNKLTELKKDLEAFIENFIFSNPYDTKYINDTYDIGAIYFKPEYDLTLYIWLELSKAYKRPILLKVARRMLKYSTFGRLDRFGVIGKGNVYSWDALIAMTKQLAKLLSPEVFAKIHPKIKEYTKTRNLHPIQPRIYYRSWYTKSTIKIHIVLLILRDLGLEILTLESIKPLAFKKTDIMEIVTYERHHIFPNDKLSIDVNRLVLTMHKNHAKLERKTKLILNLVKSRIDLTIESPQYYKNHLINWKIKWQEYLERRLYLIEHGIEKFLKEYFTDNDGNNYIIERFFNNTAKGGIEADIRTMMNKWIKKKRPIPILNTFVLNKIMKDSQQRKINGYIKI